MINEITQSKGVSSDETTTASLLLEVGLKLEIIRKGLSKLQPHQIEEMQKKCETMSSEESKQWKAVAYDDQFLKFGRLSTYIEDPDKPHQHDLRHIVEQDVKPCKVVFRPIEEQAVEPHQIEEMQKKWQTKKSEEYIPDNLPRYNEKLYLERPHQIEEMQKKWQTKKSEEYIPENFPSYIEKLVREREHQMEEILKKWETEISEKSKPATGLKEHQMEEILKKGETKSSEKSKPATGLKAYEIPNLLGTKYFTKSNIALFVCLIAIFIVAGPKLGNWVREFAAKVETMVGTEDLERKLYEAEEHFRACEKRIDPSTLCVDLIKNTTTFERCDWKTCEITQYDAPATVRSVPSSDTLWYPEDCSENHVMPKSPDCFTTKGLSALLIVRDHPECPGKLQFRCSCEGHHPHYGNASDRDCTGFIKLCKTL